MKYWNIGIMEIRNLRIRMPRGFNSQAAMASTNRYLRGKIAWVKGSSGEENWIIKVMEGWNTGFEMLECSKIVHCLKSGV